MQKITFKHYAFCRANPVTILLYKVAPRQHLSRLF